MATPFPSLTNTWHSNSYSAISPSRAELSTKGKVITITGGGTGIGASITRAFATAGSTKLAILGRRDKILKETAHAVQTEFPGAKVLPIVADVTDAADVQAAFDTIAKEFGKIDVCISNAGYLSAVESIVASEADDWWKSFETNVKGAFNIARAFLSHAKPGATLLGLTTCVAHMPPVPGHSAYAASKIAGAKMHEYLAEEHPDVHFVSMHPGVIATDMSMKSGFPGLDHVNLPSHFSVWLVSDEAKFLRGRFVWANWDVEELLARKDELKENKELFSLTLDGVSFRMWSLQQVLDWAAKNKA